MRLEALDLVVRIDVVHGDWQRRVGTAPRPRYYSAATRVAGSTASTLAAQNLNSGILPNGSSFGLVSRFAAASTKANGMNTTPSGMRVVLARVQFDRAAARGDADHVARLDAELGDGAARHRATALGSSASSTVARRVIAPVCQCSSWRPVVRMNG